MTMFQNNYDLRTHFLSKVQNRYSIKIYVQIASKTINSPNLNVVSKTTKSVYEMCDRASETASI